MRTQIDNRRGFTIVELLIVIIVIAILASVIISAYNGITKRATDSALQLDLRNARVVIENARTLSGEYPADVRTLNGGAGLHSNDSNQLFYLRSGGHYCVAVVNTSTQTVSYVSDTQSTPATGMCPVSASTVASGWWATQGVAADSTGNTYFGGGSGVYRITPAGVLTTVAGNPTQGYADGFGAAAQFRSPDSANAVASDGTMYVSDRNNHCIRVISPAGEVSTLAGLCSQTGYGMVYGIGTAARFNQPMGLALDSSGNLYVADNQNCRIRKVEMSSKTVSTFAGTICGFADGAGLTAARFTRMMDVDVDAAGNVYVADEYNKRIRKIAPDGMVSTLAGSGAAGVADGPGNVAQFSYAAGVVVDASGNVYVADRFNHRIRVVNPKGYVQTLAGDGTAASTNGTGTMIRYNNPLGIAIDASGALYTVEWSGSGVRRLSL